MEDWKQAILVIIIFLILVAIGYLLYSNLFSNKIKISERAETIIDFLAFPEINPVLADDFLSQEPYVQLESHGNLPIIPGRTGRNNPFH